MNPGDIHTLAGPYALDAVDDVERAAFSRHLAECEACAIEVAELQFAAGRLADIAAETPPPGLKTAVMAEVGRTRQVGGERRADEGGAATRWRRWTAAAVAAGIIAVGAGAGTFVVEEQRVRQAQQVSAVLEARDAVVRVTDLDGGRVTIVVSPSLDRGVAVVKSLPSPGTDHAYQLWVLNGDQPTSAGVLDAGSGDGIELFTGVRGAGAMALSREPAGGSKSPTVPIVARLPI